MRALASFLLFGWAALAATAPPIQVAPGESLQAAIDAAPPGATIQLPAGTWLGPLTIVKDLVLHGATGSVILAGEVGATVITVASSQTISVTLEGVKVAGARGECHDRPRTACPHGIVVAGRARLSLTGCEITENEMCGLFATDEVQVTAVDTSFTGNRTGLWLDEAARVRLQGGRASENVYGAIVSGEAQLVARGTALTDNGLDGILVADGARVYLWGCEISRNGRIGVCLDIPGCYRTSRAFTGLVRGAGNTVPRDGEPAANGLAPFCPQDLGFLRSELGGIYPAPDPGELLSRLPLGLPPLGSPQASLAVLEFSDLSCPYCARFALEILPQLEEEYIEPGWVKLYFLPFPVHGEQAKLEAAAAFCAAAQGLFWEFHGAAFSYAREHGYPQFEVEELAAILGSVGGDPEALRSCLAAGTYGQAVEEAVAIAHELGVRGTPTFFVGNYVIPGAYPYQVFRGVIDWALGRR